MHYVLVGPGALGCLLAVAAVKGIQDGEKFTILDYNSGRAQYITENGIVYQEGMQRTTFAVNAVSTPHKLGHVDVVLLCVKSYDIKSCLDFCTPILGQHTLLLFMQNGIRHLACENGLHRATAAYGTTTEGVTILGPGHVQHEGWGTTHLGFLSRPSVHYSTLLSHTHELFVRGGMQAALTTNILTRLWSKLFVNVGINALTAILGCKNGELLTLPGVAERMQSAIHEAVRVAEAKGVDVLGDPIEDTYAVCRKTCSNVSSMLQDVRKKKRTEIGAINGAVVAFARELGIETPENILLMEQIKDLENKYQQSPTHNAG